MQTLCLLATTALLTIVKAKLTVLSPKSLADQFQDGKIHASYANFGAIPYGQSVMGKIHFDPTNELGCAEFSTDDKTELQRSADITPFYITKRGECSFVQKVRNMENIGVAVGIVIDDKAETIQNVLMSDDGTGGGIRIPSMLISKPDGTKLLNWYTSASAADKLQLVLMAEFILPTEADNKVSFDYWMTSSSNRALDFLEDFAKFSVSLGDNLKFTPHFVYWECIGCDQRYLDQDCYGGGKYCAIEQSNSVINGKEIVMEDLRQTCLFKDLVARKENTTKWFDYIQRVHSQCYSLINEDCSKRAFEHLKLDWAGVQTCIAKSFSKPSGWELKSVSNSLIDAEIAYWQAFGTNIYPSVVINKKTYRGQIEPFSVFNAICAGFSEPPQICLKTLHREPQQSVMEAMTSISAESAVTAGEIIGLLVALILLNVLVVYCCRRRARREMQNDMQMQIESQVSQYFALTQRSKTNQI